VGIVHLVGYDVNVDGEPRQVNPSFNVDGDPTTSKPSIQRGRGPHDKQTHSSIKKEVASRLKASTRRWWFIIISPMNFDDKCLTGLKSQDCGEVPVAIFSWLQLLAT